VVGGRSAEAAGHDLFPTAAGGSLHCAHHRPGGSDALLARLSLPQEEASRALVVLIPGLGGCVDGPCIRRLAAYLVAAGFAVLRLNMRGAGAGRPSTC